MEHILNLLSAIICAADVGMDVDENSEKYMTERRFVATLLTTKHGLKRNVMDFTRYWPNRAAYDAHSVDGNCEHWSDWRFVVTGIIPKADVVSTWLPTVILFVRISPDVLMKGRLDDICRR